MEKLENDSEDKCIYGECRCCLARGNHRDIQQEYQFNGVREVYYDIFKETFNLCLSEARELTILICSRCVSRLRDAQSFRSLTARTERHLLDVIKKNMLFVDVQDSSVTDMKWESKVKEELCDDFVIEDFLSADDLPETESSELVAGEAELLARFSNVARLPTRADLPRAAPLFARHLDMLTHVEISSSAIPLVSSRRRALPLASALGEKAALAHNAETLIRYSNMTPFKSKRRIGFPCFYCRALFEHFQQLKEHTAGHDHSELARVFKHFSPESFIVYVDVTDLACSICSLGTPTLRELTMHLAREHGKKLLQGVTSRVIPFAVGAQYVCQVCSSRYETFGAVERHMNGHFRNYVCKLCGSGYVTKYRLKVHHKGNHEEGKHACPACGKIFATKQKKTNHFNAVHNMKKRFKCTKCNERFMEYFKRQKHMEDAHGLAALKYSCNVCDRSFDRRYTLSRHLKRDHLEERENQCEICNYRCYTKNELKVHMIKHNGERVFECSVCKKSYARKKTLREHMRIHNNDRRFVCPACGQAFVQKCSLKGHMKTHHFEYSLP